MKSFRYCTALAGAILTLSMGGMAMSASQEAVPATDAGAPDHVRNAVEQRVMGSLEQSRISYAGTRIDTGNSGSFYDRWEGTGRFSMQPEERRLRDKINAHIEKVIGPLAPPEHR